MAITFAGVPLLTEDGEGRFAGWLERNLSLSDLRLFGGAPVGLADGRWIPRGFRPTKVGLPTPNWSAPPRLELNSLWWPTGASRWAVGLFLCSDGQLTEVLRGLDGDGFADLKLADEINEGGGHSLTTSMHLLPPRRVVYSDNDAEDAWLLPLVDVRYWWQYRDAGTLEVDQESTWDDVIQHLAAELDEDVTYDTPDGVYDKPDITELNRPHENAAVLLDAVAWSIGLRVVRTIDGGLRLWNAQTSRLVRDKNLDGWPAGAAGQLGSGVPSVVERGYYLLAGGPGHDEERFPAAVKVVFPKCLNDIPLHTGEVYAVQRASGFYRSESGVAGTKKTFYTSYPANLTSLSSDAPENLADLTALADQIAEDYYAYQGPPYDLTAAGIKVWVPTGLDDWIWWQAAKQLPPAERQGEHDSGLYSATRAASVPYDFGVSELLHGRGEQSSSSCSSLSSQSTSGSSSSPSSISASSASSQSSISTSGSSSTSSSASTSGSSSSRSSQSTSGSSSSSSTSSSSTGIARCTVYVPTAVRSGDFLILPKAELWVDPVDLSIECRPAGQDAVYVCCDEDPEVSDGGATVACCPGVVLPTELNVTVFNRANCPAMNGQSAPLVWIAANARWETALTNCGDNMSFYLRCVSGPDCSTFELRVVHANGTCTMAPLAGCSCDPLHLEFGPCIIGAGSVHCCGPVNAAVDFVVTE